MAILGEVTARVQPLSLDEAFLDVSGALRRDGRPAAIAAGIRARVEAELGLTCSVGVAPTKFVAKLASAHCKPDGLLVVPVAKVLDFLHPLPVTVLWGVGARTAEPLHRLGVRTVGDLAETPVDTLRRALGVAAADHLHALSMGIDPRPVEAGEVEKSISADRTTDVDLTTEAQVRHELLRLAEEVGSRVRARGFVARTLGIKIRYADFRTVTRVRTLDAATDATGTIFDTAVQLYAGLGLDRPRIRLVGVKAENLTDARQRAQQLSFDDLARDRRGAHDGSGGSVAAKPPDAVLDAARERFGPAAIGFAALLPTGARESSAAERSGPARRAPRSGSAF
jgi:DNA polymerase-4